MGAKYLAQDDRNNFLQNFRGFTLIDASTTASSSPQTLTTGSSVTLTMPYNCYGINFNFQTDNLIDIMQGTASFRPYTGFYQGITPNSTITLKNNSTSSSYTFWFELLTI